MINGLDKRLHMSRTACHLSRKQVASRIGVSESMVGFYENGQRQPSLSNLIKLASLYKVSTDYLLGCETPGSLSLPLAGLTKQQVQALLLTADCFRNQNPC